MSEYFKGTLLASPIVRGSSGDTYGTHHSVLGIGGYMEVKTITNRNSIPVDGIANTINYDEISSGQRRLGMLVHVLEDDTIYQLHPKIGNNFITLATWNTYTNSQKYTALQSNSSWYPLFTTGSGATTNSNGENISKTISQLTHGFLIGDVIGYDGSDYVRVSSSSAFNIEPLGVVSKVIDSNNFILTYAGSISTVGFTDFTGATLNNGTVYYLATSGFTGKLSKYDPMSLTNVSRPILVSTSGNTGIVLQYRSLSQTQQGVTLGQYLAYTADTKIFLDKTVTGGTNIGYFSGSTGVQTLSILAANPTYSGNYKSLFNNYYRDTNGIISIGSPTYHGTLRRGYVSDFTPKKSWIYNTSLLSGNQIGWILVDGDISTSVGQCLSGYQYSGVPYSEVEWFSTGGTLNDGYYNNGGNLTLDVNGSLYTGTTYNIGGPVYSDKQFQELRFRTLRSCTPNNIGITYDDNFVYFSGNSVGDAINAGDSGIGVYDSKSGSTLLFRNLVGTGSVNIYQNGKNIVINSTGGTGGSGGTYNLSSPAVCTVGGITAGTPLLGKTAFQLFEEMLVPTLNPVLTAPSSSISTSPSGTFEVGCSISTLCVISAFDAGCINPQYTSLCNKRSNGAISYCFTGSFVSGNYVCSATTVTKCTASYVVLPGAQTWGTCSKYCGGVQPKNSKGGNYLTPLSSGTTNSVNASITGIYPYYYGKLVSGSRPAVTNGLVVSGTKVVATSTGTVTVSFNSGTSEYTWIAIPATSPSRTCWYVNALDNGNVNSALSDKYPDECVISITSAEGCWSSINYKVYMSGTVGAITNPIQFS